MTSKAPIQIHKTTANCVMFCRHLTKVSVSCERKGWDRFGHCTVSISI